MNEAKDIANKYFEKYSKGVSLVNKVILIALLAVLSNWFFVVESNYKAYVEAKQEFRADYNYLEKQLKDIKIRYHNDSTSYKEKREYLINQKDTLVSSRPTKLKEKLQNVNDWPSLIKFVFFLSDDLHTGSFILTFILTVLLLFAAQKRSKYILYLSRALRIYKEDPLLKINEYQDFNLSAPIWLAPLPKRKNIEISPLELKTIIGWGYKEKYNNFLIYILFSLIIALEARLLFLTIVVNSYKMNGVTTLSIFSIIISLYIIIYWILPKKVSDNFNTEKSPNAMSRKDFIVASSVAAFSTLCYFAIPPFIRTRIFSNPRFRYNIKPDFISSEFSNSLVINTKSDIVHFFNNQGYCLSTRNILFEDQFNRFTKNLENFNNIERLNVTKENPRLSSKSSSWIAENYALHQIQKKEYYSASQLLLYSIRQNINNLSPSYRLHDLVAILCVKYPDNIPEQTFNELVSISRLSMDDFLINRAEKWNSKEWKEKILNKKKISFNNIVIYG